MGINRFNKGSLTVEAAIIMPLFILSIFTLIMVLKLIFLHDMVQFALTETAEDIAAYGYFYDTSELLDIQKSMDDYFEGGTEDMSADSIIEEAIILMEQMEGIICEYEKGKVDDSDSTSIWGKLKSLSYQINILMDNLGDYSQNMVNYAEEIILNNLFRRGLNQGYLYTKSILNHLMINQLFKNYLVEEELVKWGVKDGLKGMDFTQSKLFYSEDDTDDLILLIVQYEVNLPSFMKVLDHVQLTNTVKVRGWTGVGRSDLASGEGNSNNLSDDTIVYIFKTGTKYHMADCPRLNIAYTIKSEKEAIEQGYSKSKRCGHLISHGDKVLVTKNTYHALTCTFIIPDVIAKTLGDVKDEYDPCNCEDFYGGK